MRALILLAIALPAYAAPAPTHPFPWITGEQILKKLNTPAETAEAVAYLKGVMDATADREWCYSLTKPNTALLQSALTDKLRALPPTQASDNAGVLAVSAWRSAWPCPDKGCCHV
jgi:hypothetical protein